MLVSQLIEGFLLDCHARNLSPATIERAYRPGLNQLCLFLDDPPAEKVTTDDLRHFLIELRQMNRFATGSHPWMKEIPDTPLSPWTVDRYLRSIKTFFRWAVKQEILKRNPADALGHVKLPKTGKIDFFSEEEIHVLLKVAKEDSFRNYAIIFLLLDTGLRRQELADLTVDDVNVISGLVVVRSGKGAKSRQLRMGNACRNVMWRYVTDFRKPLHKEAQALFLSRSRTPLTHEALGHILRRLGKKTGLHVYAHKFRHTYATMFAQKTPNALLLAHALGHESLKMAKWYVHLAGTQSTDDNSPMDALLGG